MADELRMKEETIRWIFASKTYRLARLACRTLDFVLQPLRRHRSNGKAGQASEERESEGLFAYDLPSLPLPRKPDILCLPIIDWEFRFQRPQQLMQRFAEHGHRVFFFRNGFHRGGEVALDEIRPGIYGPRLPGRPETSVYKDSWTKAGLESALAAFERFRRRERIHDAMIVVDLPFWAPFAFELRRRHGWPILYDCMDEHAGFSTNEKEMIALEERLLGESDLVLVTAAVLEEKARGIARRLCRLPNAADYDHFHHARPHEEYARLRKPVIGYYGAISDWFDVAMVEEAARARPDWTFVLIGSTFGADVSPLEDLPNVELLGERPYAEIPSWLHGFDVACIPFLDNELTRATNPVKFFEYASAGVPIASVPLRELEPFEGEYHRIEGPGGLVAAAERALEDRGQEAIERRKALARAHTWEKRFETLREAARPLQPKASIIIVSYKSLDLIRECVESIQSRTIWPDYEIVIIDNDSGPHVTRWLRDLERKDSRVRVVCNRENRGFAAANNQGLEMCRDSEFLVLLNNDTIVTRGWLCRLIRYLRNPQIGMVGPVTNWTGNEARIEVDYRNPSGMPAFAARYTVMHDCMHFDIPVPAMFCVAMRREIVERVGLLDERFERGMFEDDDYALRVRAAGFRTVCAEDVFVHHHGEASFGKLERPEYHALFAANKRRFEEKWGREWEPNRYRDWPQDRPPKGVVRLFRRDLWIWSCPLCGRTHEARFPDAVLDGGAAGGSGPRIPEIRCEGCGAGEAARLEAARSRTPDPARPLLEGGAVYGLGLLSGTLETKEATAPSIAEEGPAAQVVES